MVLNWDLVDPVNERCTVGEPGQRVVQSEIGERRLEFHAFGDVPGRDDDTRDIAVGQQGPDHDLYVAELACRVDHPNVTAAASIGGRHGLA
jgi:hypothetical protein